MTSYFQDGSHNHEVQPPLTASPLSVR